VVLGVAGVYDITALTCDFTPAPGGVINLVIGEFEVGTIDSGDVGVTT
jgi:hypothetical protein